MKLNIEYPNKQIKCNKIQHSSKQQKSTKCTVKIKLKCVKIDKNAKIIKKIKTNK